MRLATPWPTSCAGSVRNEQIVQEEAVEAVNRLARLDRREVRARFEERFSAHRMARAYESHYRKLINGGEHSTVTPTPRPLRDPQGAPASAAEL